MPRMAAADCAGWYNYGQLTRRHRKIRHVHDYYMYMSSNPWTGAAWLAFQHNNNNNNNNKSTPNFLGHMAVGPLECTMYAIPLDPMTIDALQTSKITIIGRLSDLFA